ncbi:hypothetical protein [Jatrophihabitans sp.]|jgi:hypothetical protein|uniref:hypothetical protein n=1 Tax=Jatrophihabitans sp. TaxID=1932789 RepID=UPI0038CD60F1
MILVVARATDVAARRLASRWSRHDARVLTPRDLSRNGWLAGDVSPLAPTLVANGETARASEVSAALVRIPSVSATDVSHVAPADRGYCAAEMTAFLAWWLSDLPCAVVNRPTPACLSGTDWAEPTWAIVAAELGLACRPAFWRSAGAVRQPAAVRRSTASQPAAVRQSADEPARRRVPVTVVGNRYVGTASAQLGSQAVKLARAAGVEALTVWFDRDDVDAHFLQARPWVDIDDPTIADLLLERLLPPQAAHP